MAPKAIIREALTAIQYPTVIMICLVIPEEMEQTEQTEQTEEQEIRVCISMDFLTPEVARKELTEQEDKEAKAEVVEVVKITPLALKVQAPEVEVEAVAVKVEKVVPEDKAEVHLIAFTPLETE